MMNNFVAPETGGAQRRMADSVCRAVIEVCALVLLLLAALSQDIRSVKALPLHAVFLVGSAALVAARRSNSRPAVLAFPLVIMYTYARIDAARLSVHLPGNIILPLSALALGIMSFSFVIAILLGDAAEIFRLPPVRSMLAVVLFVTVMSVVLCAMSSFRNRCDWQGIRGGIGNAFVGCMLFVVLREHLSRSRAAMRFGWYIIAFATIVIVGIAA